MKMPSYAQLFLIAMGFDDLLVTLAHKRGRLPHHTKKGPGRRHQHGKPEAD
ncbi:MAG: hypothetical protein KGZ68_04640 [Dechloromonas sp.]|nr:hypothetical protein [Dechloromonas sp.]